MNLSSQFDRLEIKIRQLGSKLERLREENARLKTEMDQLKGELDRRQGESDSLKDRLERLQREREEKQAVMTASRVDTNQVRQQIHHYLREIDKCIEWLEEQ